MARDGTPLLEIDFNDLEFYECLSSGTYGTVYRAKWKTPNCIVAVKKVLVLEKEAQVLSTLKHRNIIQFFGAVTKPPNYCIVTEFAALGSLYSFLMNKQNPDLDFNWIIEWAIQIASGTNYLHNEAPITVIHRDLKSKNIVISSEFVCKLCDFGTSKFLAHTTKMSIAGTYPWMSPEIIQSLPVSEAADTWSYGVVLWELLTREVPFQGLNDFRIAYMVVEENVRLKIPSSCPKALGDLMTSCWSRKPEDRPSLKVILALLEGMQCDGELSSRTNSFLKEKDKWRQEILKEVEVLKQREKELQDKEGRLYEWEQRLSRREENLETHRRFQRQVSYDVSRMTEPEVVNWLTHLDIEIDSDALDRLSLIFLQNHIDGRRLLMLTENDLLHMGVDSFGYRKTLYGEIQRLGLNNQRLINFPPLSHSSNTVSSGHIRSKSLQSGGIDTQRSTINMTLLFGFYVRPSPLSNISLDSATVHHSDKGRNPPWKYKVFLDIDDQDCDDPYMFIQDVVFINQSAPYEVHRISKPPFVYPRWLIYDRNDNLSSFSSNSSLGNELSSYNTASTAMCNGELQKTSKSVPSPQMKVIVNYNDVVKRPRNTTLYYQIDLNSRGLVEEKSVQLNVTFSPSIGNQKINGTATVGSHLLHNSISTPILKGAWQEKRFPDAIPELPPTPKRSSVWADIVSGLRNSRSSSPESLGVQLTPRDYRKASMPTPSPKIMNGAPSFTTTRTFSDGQTSVKQNRPRSLHGKSSVTFSLDSTDSAGEKDQLRTAERRLSAEDLLSPVHEMPVFIESDLNAAMTQNSILHEDKLENPPDERAFLRKNQIYGTWPKRGRRRYRNINSKVEAVEPPQMKREAEKHWVASDEIQNQWQEEIAPANSLEHFTNAAKSATGFEKRPQGSSYSAAVYGGYQKWTWPEQPDKPKL